MSSLGEPIAGVPFKGKLFPEGMPEEYREIDTLQFIQSLSGKHLRQWSNFYEIDIPEATTRAEEEAKLWKFLGGLPVGRGRAAGMEARKRSREDEEDDEDDEDYETERSAWKKRAIVPR
ncbi:hypothetical protein IAR55_005092 [Kwoniella newhampshirensis]|uniref:Mug135-like C-terminal domain-containing protein n=1 Tax=Kwoniella newhampshirensis TaxID=1651941 RepID=A0AAW0YX64_9TREE